ncbi:glycogen synthase [Nakamurella endophytica]|uniref:Glycogen synthase n=1 Tax=Nakamurella endophytica TaxID=1748367 RepID=A0A917STR0_9ACTN|nr:glycogen synthase [Nakamurella endophytica]GGL95819.1 glycogen synthase [Nakamurella endophytica]
MRTAILTREFPPDIYGGAGVHVDYLVRELRTLIDVEVHAFGEDRPGARGHRPAAELAGANAALTTLSVDLSMVAALGSEDIDVAHSHTWYANMAGHLAKILYDVPHVVTAHSLEPRRPWKAEQLGGGYRLSSWAEKTAYDAADAVIAVSDGMRTDVLDCYPELDPAKVHVIRNGIDTDIYRPSDERSLLVDKGVDLDAPIASFVGRITRQKGVGHLIAAAHRFDPGVQLVLCAGAPDTPEIAAETAAAIAELQQARPGVFWFDGMLTLDQVKQVLTASTVFCCPSVYEPLGIVNLEAMACGAPVVASDVGGIPEVVDDGVTGRLVHYDADRPREFEEEFAAAVNATVADPDGARAAGRAGRERAVTSFSWTAVAEQTVELYRSLR